MKVNTVATAVCITVLGVEFKLKDYIKIKGLKMIFFPHDFTFIVPQFFLGLPVLPLLAPYPWVNDAGPAARKSNL